MIVINDDKLEGLFVGKTQDPSTLGLQTILRDIRDLEPFTLSS